jgi:peptidoglycan hydrolase-like protein with peptidoglycan-binding domain
MGKDWGHQDCPGPPIINQKAIILARAKQLAGTPHVVKPPTVKQGSTGRYVVLAQTRCNEVPDTGADVATDGQFGPKTEDKVQRVQRHFKIKADGIVGPITWGKLGVH